MSNIAVTCEGNEHIVCAYEMYCGSMLIKKSGIRPPVQHTGKAVSHAKIVYTSLCERIFSIPFSRLGPAPNMIASVCVLMFGSFGVNICAYLRLSNAFLIQSFPKCTWTEKSARMIFIAWLVSSAIFCSLVGKNAFQGCR